MKYIAQIGNVVNEDILHGMERAFFVNAWADWQEENGWPAGSPSGMDVMDLAPQETPAEAKEAARKLYKEIEQINNVNLSEFVPPAEDGLSLADTEDWPSPHNERLFGHYLAMEAMGHGVSWSDDWPDHGLEVPYVEFSWLEFSRLDLDPEDFPDIEREENMSPIGGSLTSLGQQAQPQQQMQQPQQQAQPQDQTDMGAEIKFKDMFSKDVASWISMEARLLSMNNYGKWKNLEEANDKIDKAVGEIASVLSKAGKAETERIVNEERQELLEEMSSYIPVQEIQDVQQPVMGPVERPNFPDQDQPQMGPMGAALRNLKKAPMSAMLKRAFDKSSQGWEYEDISDDDPDFKSWKKKQDEKDRLEEEDFRSWKKKLDTEDHRRNSVKKAWGEGDSWESGEAELWIMNDEGLYHYVARLLNRFPYTYDSSRLAVELENSFLPEALSSVMDPSDVKKIDWQELAKELKDSFVEEEDILGDPDDADPWGAREFNKMRDKKLRRGKRAQEESWDTGEVKRWLMNDFAMYNKALDLASSGLSPNQLGDSLEREFSGAISGVDPNAVDWYAVADHVITLSEQEY